MYKTRQISILLLVIGCAFSRGSLAQEGIYPLVWTENITKTLEYNKEMQHFQYLHFKDVIYEGEMVPYLIRSIPLQDHSKTYALSNLKYEAIPDSLLLHAELPILAAEETPMIHVFSGGRESFMLDIRIPALRKDPATGLVERLVSYEIVSHERSTANAHIESTRGGKMVDNSLLGSGFWYKFKVRNTGIYKLTYSDLLEMGLSNPSQVRLFGYGGRQLSYWNNDPRPQDMAEIPYYMNKGSDGSFNSGDYILFYAEGPLTWDYNASDSIYRQKIHGYSGYIFYFITDSHGPGTQIPEVDYSQLNADRIVTQYDDYACYEREWYNLVGSGRIWYSRRIDLDAFDTTFTFPNLVTGNEVRIEARIAGRSEGFRKGYMYVDNEEVVSKQFTPMVFTYSYNTFAENRFFEYSTNATGNQLNIGVSYDKFEQTDEAYLDYITLNARSELRLSGSKTFFRDQESVGPDRVAEFQVGNAGGSTRIWDVTEINSIRSLKGVLGGGTFSFHAPADSLREYVVLDLTADFPSPIINSEEKGVGVVENQNLRLMPSVDYIIVAPGIFRVQAERLADFHRNESKLKVAVVNPQEIYNEFSSGTPDVSALRDFFRYQYIKGDSTLKYVLLFGDGSYNNHMLKEGNTNYILTYQSKESLSPGVSYTSDDFFGMLGEDEGGEDYSGRLDGKMEIGIGRLPVKALNGGDEEARGVVDKILGYYGNQFTDWRRRLCFVGDDGYDPGGFNEEERHMKDANEIATHVESLYKGFEMKKVYLDAYPQVSSATGASYPDVNEELRNLFERGILIFTYTGHGSENQITGEIILQKSDLQSMKNRQVLPLFITATCQFSRYDHVDIEEDNNYSISALTSAGEAGILNEEGGAVALLSTSRVVYSWNNVNLVKNVYSYLFKKNSEGKPYTLGEVIRRAKNDIGPEINKLNFTLLGDPAMILNYPKFLVCTDSINGLPVGESMDTLKAFEQVTISGYVAYEDSSLIDNFNGFVYPQVYDKYIEITTFGNDNQPPWRYRDQKNLLYKGKATVTNGRFRFSFVVPKDIAYNIDKGKISYYAENGVIDAKGEYRDIYVGGTADNAVPDYEGPRVELFMNDNRFEDGGITDRNPHIYAELQDENGINTTGVGIGHDIIAALDNGYSKPYVLNDYYEASADDYTQGIVRYPLKDLSEGEHYLDLRVWDVFNNSSEASIRFVVMSVDDLLLEKVINYPNPAQDYTEFVYTHNAPDMDHEVVLEVFDMMGRLVARKEYSQFEGGYVSQPIHWDFTSNQGAQIGAGIYPYRLQVTTPIGTSYLNHKLIIIR